MANATFVHARSHYGQQPKRSLLSLFKKAEKSAKTTEKVDKPLPTLGRTIIIDTVRSLKHVRDDIDQRGWDYAEKILMESTVGHQATVVLVTSMLTSDIAPSKNPKTKQQQLLNSTLRELGAINARWERAGWIAGTDLAASWSAEKRVSVIMLASLLTQDFQKTYA